ncbi:MAG: hypothetical protein ACLR2G_09510 [Phascolarctobacterium faecium]
MLELRKEVKDTCTCRSSPSPGRMYAYQGGDKWTKLYLGADLVGAIPILNIHVKTALKASESFRTGSKIRQNGRYPDETDDDPALSKSWPPKHCAAASPKKPLPAIPVPCILTTMPTYKLFKL